MDNGQFWAEVHGPESKACEGKPYGWLQWKGTAACIDLHCVCGALGHVDAQFFYHYQCAKCGRKFALSGYVKLIELNEEQVKYLERSHVNFRTDLSVIDETNGII